MARKNRIFSEKKIIFASFFYRKQLCMNKISLQKGDGNQTVKMGAGTTLPSKQKRDNPIEIHDSEKA